MGDKPIWVGVDETTDAMARYVANVLIGRLDNEKYHAPYLANVVFLEKTNSATISHLVNSTLKFLWPNFDADLLKLLLSDATAFMLKSGRVLKVSIPHSFTSLVWPMVSIVPVNLSAKCFQRSMISSPPWRIFVKAPPRIIIWKEVCPEVPLPLEPVLTRWGTWIDAALFYVKKFEKVKTVISQL